MEDDAHLRALYRAALTGAGYGVVTVEDGVDALRHLEMGHVPDLVLLDLELPRLGGRDLHREMQAHAVTKAFPWWSSPEPTLPTSIPPRLRACCRSLLTLSRLSPQWRTA